MAECASIPSSVHLQLRRAQPRASVVSPRNVYAGIVHRQHSSGNFSVVRWFSSQKAKDVFSPQTCLKGFPPLKENSLNCCCLGSLTNPEAILPSNWVAVVDQVLLMTSMILAHLARVVPCERMLSSATSNTAAPESTATSSSYQETKTDSWDKVNQKLADALESIEVTDSLSSSTTNYAERLPSNLSAIYEGPRIRLLWATLLQLQKQVSDISNAYEVMDHKDWLAVSSKVIQGCIQPVCIKWLEEELALVNLQPDKELFSKVSASLKGDGTVLQTINRLGKAELYAELFFFLRFGSLRNGCYYATKLLTVHAVDILEDLVITLADGLTSIYLELISVDSSMAPEMNGLGMTVCNLSTRSLQRLRNEVALNQWLQQNFKSVVLMYEDQFELFVLQSEQSKDCCENKKEEHIWWKRFVFTKRETSSSHSVQIMSFPLPLKRTKELRALTGWRYYFSLCLEFSDITMPLVRIAFAKRDVCGMLIFSNRNSRIAIRGFPRLIEDLSVSNTIALRMLS